MWLVGRLLYRRVRFLLRLVGRHWRIIVFAALGCAQRHAAFLDCERRLLIEMTLPRAPERRLAPALRFEVACVRLLVVRRRDEVLAPRVAVLRLLAPVERLRLDGPRLDRLVAVVVRLLVRRAVEVRRRFPLEDALRREPADVVERPRPLVLLVLLLERLPRVEADRAPADLFADALRLLVFREPPSPDADARRFVLRVEPAERVPAERVCEPPRRAPLARTLRRLAFVLPRARACAVSRAISLLKLLCSPPAVSSCTSNARPLSSNFLNQSSHEIFSSESAPL